MTIQSPRLIEIRRTADRGLGVFAAGIILEGQLIEESPVLLLDEQTLYTPAGTSRLADYLFAWSNDRLALSLGYGSLYNHSYSPNAYYEDTDRDTKRYISLRDIQPNEEITINYNGDHLDASPVGFEVR